MLTLYTKFTSRTVLVCLCRIKSIRRFSTPNILGMLEGMEISSPDGIIKDNNPNPPLDSNYRVKVEVLGSGANGSPRCVHMQTDKEQFFFNCGEGVQRLTSECRVRLSRVPHMFITYPSWENLSGIIGTSLTLQAIGLPQLFIHGHSNIANMYSATTKFVCLRNLKLKMQGCEHNQEFSTGGTRIKYVHIYPSTSTNIHQNNSESALNSPEDKSLSTDTEDETQHDVVTQMNCSTESNSPNSKKREHKRKKRSQSEGVKKMKVKEGEYCVSYICKTPQTAGTLMYEKCLELGVPTGPLLGKLKSGEDIKLENGTVVKSSDVKESDIPGVIIIVIECPSEAYLDNLLREPAFYRHQSGNDNLDNIASLVVHFTHVDIVSHPKYQEWISRFGNNTKHLYINKNNRLRGSSFVHNLQCKLNLINPEIFPMLQGNGISDSPQEVVDEGHKIIVPGLKDDDPDKVYVSCEGNPHIRGELGCEVYLRPSRPYDYSLYVKPRRESIISELFEMKGFNEALESYKNDIKNMEPELNKKDKYPKILFLGTGSSQPNKSRNSSGILIFIDEKRSAIFDCGEGTYNQMFNFFGPEKVGDILRNISLIYVSHMHADHHLGLISILKERYLAFKQISETENYKPPFVLAPIQITRWLGLLNEDFEEIEHLYTLIPSGHVVEGLFSTEKVTKCRELLDLSEINLTFVEHCPGAFAIAITHKNGWKLTYSGDTKPCSQLVKLGLNSDIVIHEATMEDTLVRQANIKAHCTTSQAIHSGIKMDAKFIMLTHFSQRYPYVPLINNQFTDHVGIAFDNMMVQYNNLPVLPKMIKLMKTYIFASHYEKMEDRRAMYILRRKRQADNAI